MYKFLYHQENRGFKIPVVEKMAVRYWEGEANVRRRAG